MAQTHNSAAISGQSLKASLLTALMSVAIGTGFCPAGGLAQDFDSADGEQQYPTTINWLKDANTAFEQARRLNRPVLVDLYTDWCGWCKRLDRDVYANPEIARMLNSQFVFWKANAEDGAEGQRIAKKFRVSGYPCTMVINPDGSLRGLFYGYKPAQEFPAALNQILQKSATANQDQGRY